MNIPGDFAKMMDLAVGTPVVFQYDEERKRLIIEKVKAIETDDGRIINIVKSKAD